MRRAVAACVAVLACGLAADARAHWAPSIPLHNTQHAVSLHFCGHSNVRCRAALEAWEVARCETSGTFSVWATNGQYLGLWQMGAGERERWGHGWHPWAQAKAASRYYRHSLRAHGYGWLPWDWRCRP
jgi:hypothetical protein